MPYVTKDHFKRAAADIGANGDNDTIPFDIDNRFIKDKQSDLADMAYYYFHSLEKAEKKDVAKRINSLQIFSERLLVPTGPSGFRITTKIHPFWNIYFNGLGVAIAEKHEPSRSDRAHSYRYAANGDILFNNKRRWRAYREATLADPELEEGAVVVQTDISSFYEHVYHHRLENCIDDLFASGSTVATQVDRLLSKFAAGRSFGLPVGGQCSRILAELLMSSIDQMLSDAGIVWHRYVDDFTLITKSQEDAYQALSILSNALADYGLSLNRSKTTILSAKHYNDYVETQLGVANEEGRALREIDLYYDHYSDSSEADYASLKKAVEKLDVSSLLNLELNKSQPDTFLIAQVGRTLKFHPPEVASQLCATLLSAGNLHSFRASWSTIMRGVAALRSDDQYKEVFDALDVIIDQIPEHSPHLLKSEASCLHYMKTIRFKKTTSRAQFVLKTYESTKSETIKRACIECWHIWLDRPRFVALINQWPQLSVQQQRMAWLAFANIGDDGRNARKQRDTTLDKVWKLGIDSKKDKFWEIYKEWAEDGITI